MTLSNRDWWMVKFWLQNEFLIHVASVHAHEYITTMVRWSAIGSAAV